MNTFGTNSRTELETTDPILVEIAFSVLELKDHSILKGHRNEVEQNAAYNSSPQRSKLKFPNGKHNELPSRAIDVQTWPVPKGYTQEQTERLLRHDQLYLLGLYVGVAWGMGVMLRTGADWDMDGEIADNGWDDLFHVEIAEN